MIGVVYHYANSDTSHLFYLAWRDILVILPLRLVDFFDLSDIIYLCNGLGKYPTRMWETIAINNLFPLPLPGK